MKSKLSLTASAHLLSSTFVISILTSPALIAAPQTAPPAPVLAAPANGASLVQPINLRWQPIVDPDGPIGSYTWQVSTTTSFASVIASGFNNLGDPSIPLSTDAQVSGLANGNYFWRVKGAQNVGGTIGFIDSPWSAARSFTVTGLGPAPAGIPTISSPSGTSFHPFEFFDITWSQVAGANYYILEADDDSGFSYPITLSGGPTMMFGNKFHAGWGNPIASIFYRIRAVSADNVWGRPSSTLTVHISSTAPVLPAPTPLFPIGGATVTLPITFDWTDTANPQIPGYDLDIDTNPNFPGAIGVLLIQGVSRSDYMVVQDPLVEHVNHLPPGTYFWRVRALHGSAFGPWSAGQRFIVAASPPTPPGLDLFWILADPGSVQGGNPTAARVALNAPAPSGGALVRVASDFPGVEMPSSVFIPAGATDAVVSPVTTPPVSGASIGTLRAAYGAGWQQSSIGCWPILWGASLSADSMVGGSALTGTVTLLGPAPAGGVTVTLVSSNTSLARPPASVLVPEGATAATFGVTTSAVTVPTQVVLSFGTAFEKYRAPDTWLVLTPAGSPAPAPTVSAITLNPTTVPGGSIGTGTVTLTSPAPSGGAQIHLSGSMEGDVVVPQSVTVPFGSLSADFPVTPPPVARPHWVLIQASYGFTGSLHATTLRVEPVRVPSPPLFAIGVNPNGGVGGITLRGTVGLSVPASTGGAVVTLASSDASVVHVPASVAIAAGNSTASFTITTSSVLSGASVSVTGTSGGVSKIAWIFLAPDPNAPLALLSVTPSVSGALGGHPINVTLFMNGNAPAGGVQVAMTSSNPAAAQVPPSVTIPGGLGFASFNITTSPVSVDTPVTITGTFGVSQTAAITVLAPQVSLASIALNPASVAGGSPSTGTATLSAAAPAAGTVVSLSSSNTAAATLPASVTVAAGATSATFPVTTSAVASTTSVTISGSAGGTSRSALLSVLAPSVVSLSSIALNPASVTGGSPSTGTATLSAAAPAGGTVVSLSSSNTSAATVPASVMVAGGATSATFPVTTNAVASTTAVTITGSAGGASRTATLTVNNGSPPVLHITLSGVPTSIARGQTFTTTGSVANTGATGASGYTVLISFTPTDSMRLQSPQASTQSVATVAAGGTQIVSWQIRADRAGAATLTMTLRNASGVTVDTASRAITITN